MIAREEHAKNEDKTIDRKFCRTISSPCFSDEVYVRECPKKIIVNLFVADKTIKFPEVVTVKAAEVEPIDGERKGVRYIKTLGSMSIERQSDKFPEKIEFDISKEGYCPVLTEISLTGAGKDWMRGHFANIHPDITGLSYSLFGGDVSLMIKRGPSRF